MYCSVVTQVDTGVKGHTGGYLILATIYRDLSVYRNCADHPVVWHVFDLIAEGLP